MIDPRDVIAAWGIEARSFRRPERGTNNLVWIVDDGFVLRVYQNLDARRVAAEHRLLAAIDEHRPPFAVPMPIPIASGGGETIVATPDGPAALYSLLLGRIAGATDLALVGAAVGDLMAVLGELPHDVAPMDWRVPLAGTHPAVPDVGALVEELRDVAPDAAGLDTFANLWERVDTDYERETLPVQVCHLDVGMSNVLIDGGRVTAILDFEIAGLDLRVNEFVGALVNCTDTPDEERVFTDGFRSCFDLRSDEWAAVPRLRVLRRLATTVWRAGRWREGKATLDEVLARLEALQNLYI